MNYSSSLRRSRRIKIDTFGQNDLLELAKYPKGGCGWEAKYYRAKEAGRAKLED